ncbi:MAG: 4-hydroxy-tetrahydrodipicolinate reductase [Paracoccaceae bacterium]|nr:4-hydroxy-tetrahydrodipicolinate reductase [Paracoccaceae bacterium]MDE2912381.1 4-hydroxy-tetrahydrodipicolinate reductase [Paracoccaceae bacterium]
MDGETERTAVTIVGVAGRMGQILCDAVLGEDRMALVGATEQDGHPWVGRDLGPCLGKPDMGVTVDCDPLDAFARSQAIIDFTAPAATVAHAELAAQARAVHVIGTTGFSAGDCARIAAAAAHTPIIRAGNMSLGVNLLSLITRQVAAALDEDFDIEVVEAHHRHKRDAPSGTALMLGEAAAAGRGRSLPELEVRTRDGITGPRRRGTIGFSAIRGGDVVGEHDVIFAADGERIVIRHLATDRRIFSRGAIRAALWGQGRDSGEYDMADVLGLGQTRKDLP